MHHLLYMSTAVGLPTEDDLKAILVTSRRNNEANNVTGMLLYSEGTFIQLLEGLEQDVKSTYRKLLTDRRHKNAICLIDTAAQDRAFPEWWMGFTQISQADLLTFKGYLKNPASSVIEVSGDQPALFLLKTFVETNKRGLS